MLTFEEIHDICQNQKLERYHDIINFCKTLDNHNDLSNYCFIDDYHYLRSTLYKFESPSDCHGCDLMKVNYKIEYNYWGNYYKILVIKILEWNNGDRLFTDKYGVIRPNSYYKSLTVIDGDKYLHIKLTENMKHVYCYKDMKMTIELDDCDLIYNFISSCNTSMKLNALLEFIYKHEFQKLTEENNNELEKSLRDFEHNKYEYKDNPFKYIYFGNVNNCVDIYLLKTSECCHSWSFYIHCPNGKWYKVYLNEWKNYSLREYFIFDPNLNVYGISGTKYWGLTLYENKEDIKYEFQNKRVYDYVVNNLEKFYGKIDPYMIVRHQGHIIELKKNFNEEMKEKYDYQSEEITPLNIIWKYVNLLQFNISTYVDNRKLVSTERERFIDNECSQWMIDIKNNVKNGIAKRLPFVIGSNNPINDIFFDFIEEYQHVYTFYGIYDICTDIDNFINIWRKDTIYPDREYSNITDGRIPNNFIYVAKLDNSYDLAKYPEIRMCECKDDCDLAKYPLLQEK